jgi:flagellum-specific peptidoglycan hydrolase FlgJ
MVKLFLLLSCLWHGRYSINVSSAADMEIYAGRYDVEFISFYDENGLPIFREWLTSSESKGRHISDPAVKKRFKKWRKNHNKEFLQYIVAAAKEEARQFPKLNYKIIAAQAIIESNWGLSRLSASNNLFGHKFRASNSFAQGTITAHDDSPTDQFVIYKSKWWSLRMHSKILMKYSQRFSGKQTLNKWLKALCGGMNKYQSARWVKNGRTVYATSCFKGKVCYAKKLKRIIRQLKL